MATASLRSRPPPPFHNRSMPPAEPGTYFLVLRCSSTRAVRVGRLGTMRLLPGYYLYVGSAYGPGGLRARIGHHCHPADRLHWHVDYLRRLPAWNPCGTPVARVMNMNGRRRSPRCRGGRWCCGASGVQTADATRTCTGSGSRRQLRRWGGNRWGDRRGRRGRGALGIALRVVLPWPNQHAHHHTPALPCGRQEHTCPKPT